MKKAWLGVALVLAMSTGLCAQVPLRPWTWDLQGGYNTSSGWLESGWMAETGIAYSWTDHFSMGVHGAYYQGSLKGFSSANALYSFMLTPELRRSVSPEGEVYVFLGAGVAGMDSYSRGLGWQRVHIASQTKWAGEAGIGYRHFFNSLVGMTFQFTYTHMAFDQSVDLADGRFGLVMRF